MFPEYSSVRNESFPDLEELEPVYSDQPAQPGTGRENDGLNAFGGLWLIPAKVKLLLQV